MLHTSLSLAFLAAPAPAVLPVETVDLMPEDAVVVLEFGDLRALAVAEDEERSSWLRALTDERVREATLEVGEFTEEDSELLGALLGLAAEIRGGALGILDLDEGRMVAVLETTAAFLPDMTEAFEAAELPLAETELFGCRALVDDVDAEFTTVVALELGERVVLGFGDVGAVLDDVEALVGRCRSGEGTEGWWANADRGGLEVQIGVHVDFTALPMPAEVALTLGEVVDSAYVGIGMGEGDEGSLVASARLVQNPVTEAFAEAFTEDVEPELLLGAPEGVETAQVLRMDVPALIEATVMLVDAIEPDADAGEVWAAALEAGGGFLGMDIEDDLIGNLSGTFFSYQWEVMDVEGVYLEEDPDAMMDAFPVMGVGLSDEEPFLELLETLAPFTGDLGGELDETDDATTLVLEPEPGVELRVRVGNGHLIVGVDARRMEAVVARLGRTDFEGAVDERLFRAVQRDLGGAGIGLTAMGGIFEAMRLLPSMDEDFTEGEEAMFEALLDALEENIGGRLLTDGWMREDSVGFRILTR